jgi:hypothetical protein
MSAGKVESHGVPATRPGYGRPRAAIHPILNLTLLKETIMTIKGFSVRALAGAAFTLLSFVPNNVVPLTPVAFAQDQTVSSNNCTPVGGVLFTNINVIAGVTNLGPVYGDLAGSVAATILGQNSNGSYNVQHYWVTTAGDTITLKMAVLYPTYPTSDRDIVAVPWGSYRAYITGGTGRLNGATGHVDAFGMADFIQTTLVLRYRGEVCYAH